MVSGENMVELRDVLASLYREKADIVRLLEDPDVGMDPSRIEFHPKAVNTWHNILSQATLALGLLHKSKGESEQAKKYISNAIKLFRECEAEVYLKQATDALESLG